ncbi:MAG TPA: hypothetical protein VMB25_12410 [Bryobacteraceae bacterium]|nr:hypothetical protein [Bryobacteraceae bacterium]
MVTKRISWLLAASGLAIGLLAEGASKTEPIPRDSLELVTGDVSPADTPESRQSVLALLNRARDNYDLRSAGQGYDLKVSFRVDSGGATAYDGAWQMEDLYDPQHGLRWTATAANGRYTITEISYQGNHYADGTPGAIPLRLHEARAALFGAISPAANLERSRIRTSTATYLGEPVTCALLSAAGKHTTNAPGRRWMETEECIDLQSGLLMTHSQAPGRYYAYDYMNGPQLAGHLFPRKVIVTEGGSIVSRISVDSLEPLTNADPNLFLPTEEMKTRGRAVAMGGAEKFSRMVAPSRPGSGAQFHSLCVFGLVTDAGKLVDAHSLQPSDPYSAAAVAAASQMDFSPAPVPGEVRPPPSQHFVFVIERFVSNR